jgi:acylpyruvate hydrolase
VNGKKRQEGSTHDMIFPVGTLLEYCRERYPLSPGDLILTGG